MTLNNVAYKKVRGVGYNYQLVACAAYCGLIMLAQLTLNVCASQKVEDRFIPSRKAMDMDLSRFHLCNYSGENSKPAKANGGELADEYKVNLATGMCFCFLFWPTTTHPRNPPLR